MDILKYKLWIFSVTILVVFLVPISTVDANSECGPKLIIDHDGGADDSLAIFMAILYEKYFNGPKIIALTTAHGNVDEDQTFLNTQRILDTAERRDIPIYRGSNKSLLISLPPGGYYGEDGLGDNYFGPIEAIEAQPLHAALGIIELANKYPGEISVVTLGPLTNLALAVRLDPKLFSRLSHLYVGGGNVYGATELSAEFNARQDVESYQIVMQEAKPEKVTIVPFSQVRTKTITRQWREQVLGAIPTKIMNAQNAYERISLLKEDYWSRLDPIVMGIALNDTIVGDVKYSQNGIVLCADFKIQDSIEGGVLHMFPLPSGSDDGILEILTEFLKYYRHTFSDLSIFSSGEDRGINTNDFTTAGEANVKLMNSILQEQYQDLLLSIFSAELQ